MRESVVVTGEQLTGPLRTNESIFITWCIYERPKDFPEHFVVRRWFWGTPDHCCQICETLEQARAAVPEGHYRMPPEPNDDRSIREVWI